MILRDYQTRAIDLVRAEYRRGRRAVLLVLPTGAGKTATAAQLIAMLEGGNGQLASFFSRQPSTRDGVGAGQIETLYKTKAARYYREHLALHVKALV